jgi:hypothetical protein
VALAVVLDEAGLALSDLFLHRHPISNSTPTREAKTKMTTPIKVMAR